MTRAGCSGIIASDCRIMNQNGAQLRLNESQKSEPGFDPVAIF